MLREQFYHNTNIQYTKWLRLGIYCILYNMPEVLVLQWMKNKYFKRSLEKFFFALTSLIFVVYIVYGVSPPPQLTLTYIFYNCELQMNADFVSLMLHSVFHNFNFICHFHPFSLQLENM